MCVCVCVCVSVSVSVCVCVCVCARAYLTFISMIIITSTIIWLSITRRRHSTQWEVKIILSAYNFIFFIHAKKQTSYQYENNQLLRIICVFCFFHKCKMYMELFNWKTYCL